MISRLDQARRIFVYSLMTGVLGALGLFLDIEILVIGSGICALILGVIGVLLWRSGMREQHLAQQADPLLHWEYDEQLWYELVNRLVPEISSRVRIGIWLVAVLLVIGLLAWVLLSDGEERFIIAAIVAPVLLMSTALGLWLPGRRRRLLLAAPHRLLLSSEGMLIGNEFHDFQIWGSRVENATVERDGKPVLRVVYSYKSRYGRQYIILEVLIPSGQDQQARKVAALLCKQE